MLGDGDDESSADGVPVRAVSRAFEILQTINRLGNPTIMEIKEDSRLPYPTVYRMVMTLVHDGWIETEATRKRYPSEAGAGMVCRGHCFNNGLIMRAVGDTMIIAPPLVISKAEIDELVTKARKCLDLTLSALQA